MMPEIKRRILIVEDDADIREDLRTLLRDCAFEVSTASDGKKACEQLRQSTADARPDLVLLDLMMPVMDGWHFRAEQLKDPTLAQIPVILLSGARDLRREATALGVAGYVKKPFKLNALLDAIGRATSVG